LHPPGSLWVFGVLVNNVWSVGSRGDSPSRNNRPIQPFINQPPNGKSTMPDHHDQRGRSLHPAVDGADRRASARSSISASCREHQISAYYNVAKPDDAANWQIRAQVQLMFPK
jgi:hypothetical protein